MPVPSNIILTPNAGVAPFSMQITGNNLFERPNYRTKETFTLNTPDSLPGAWRGTDPTRVDGIIGKGIVCSASGLRYLRACSGVDTSTAGGNNMWFRSDTAGVSSLFISMWIKPTSLTNAGLFFTGSGSMLDPQQLINMGAQGRATAAIALQSNGRLIFSIMNGAAAATKFVYTNTGVIVNNTWQHILCQWTSVAPGVSVDPPVIWVSGVKQSVTPFTNANFSSLIPYTTSSTYTCTTIGYGYTSTTTPPSSTNSILPFDGIICDVYTGNAFLSDADVLKYANLPKVELIKAV